MALTTEQLTALRTTAVGDSGNRLKVAIDLAGETQSSVARALGYLNASTVSDHVRGRSADMSLSNAQKYARHFGCQVDDLFPILDAERVA